MTKPENIRNQLTRSIVLELETCPDPIDSIIGGVEGGLSETTIEYNHKDYPGIFNIIAADATYRVSIMVEQIA